MNDVKNARIFAKAAHGEQKYGDEPYMVHLDAVAGILAPYGKTAQIVGYLHDTVEDTAVTCHNIMDHFGAHVATVVDLVTDCEGQNRKERKAKTNRKLASVTPEYHAALVVKAADRLANVRASAKGNKGLLSMYRKEHAAFKDAVYREGLAPELWEELDRLLA